MNSERNPIFTVGHSTHSIADFLGLLKQHGITAVADVRSRPYSQFNPQYNRETLEEALREAGIGYVFLGDQLGARSDDPACYTDNKVQYDLLAETDSFKEGLNRIGEGSEKFRIALMCAEKEPLDCHRTILVARELEKEGFDVHHILEDGSTETHHDTMLRLLAQLRISHDDLFRTEAEIFLEAYKKREAVIAYERKVVPRQNTASAK